MKKKLLMGLALIAIMTSAVFAQQPTLDKLAFEANGSSYRVKAANSNISGAVVIPDTYNNRPVTEIATAAFSETSITSVVIPASITRIQSRGFDKCNNLTSVTFLGDKKQVTLSNGGGFSNYLINEWTLDGPGTYTRKAGDNIWTKQGGAVCPTCGQPLP